MLTALKPPRIFYQTEEKQRMIDPKVSIIIPVYNGEKFLKATIESCLNQDYSNLELIVVDDCSTDASAAIINQYDIIKIKNEINLGINRSVNNAVSISTGEYFIFLGHDDKLEKDHVRNMLSEFDLNTVFVYCNSIIIDESDNELQSTFNEDKNNIKNLKFRISKKNTIISTGLMIRKKSFIEVGGYNENFRNYGEWHLWIKLLSVGDCKYSLKSKPYYRKHTTNISNTFKSPKVKAELFAYYNFCRHEAFQRYKGEFSLMEKVDLLWYDGFTKLKYHYNRFKNHKR